MDGDAVNLIISRRPLGAATDRTIPFAAPPPG